LRAGPGGRGLVPPCHRKGKDGGGVVRRGAAHAT